MIEIVEAFERLIIERYNVIKMPKTNIIFKYFTLFKDKISL